MYAYIDYMCVYMYVYTHAHIHICIFRKCFFHFSNFFLHPFIIQPCFEFGGVEFFEGLFWFDFLFVATFAFVPLLFHSLLSPSYSLTLLFSLPLSPSPLILLPLVLFLVLFLYSHYLLYFSCFTSIHFLNISHFLFFTLSLDLKNFTII